jgi:hypothetical protein
MNPAIEPQSFALHVRAAAERMLWSVCGRLYAAAPAGGAPACGRAPTAGVRWLPLAVALPVANKGAPTDRHVWRLHLLPGSAA